MTARLDTPQPGELPISTVVSTEDHRKPTPNSPVRVAIIGAGYFAQFQYKAWKRISDVDVVACADQVAERACDVSARYAISAVFRDAETLLAETDVDLLDIVTPPDTHLATIQLAARHGVDVICQKPFCATLEQALEAVKIADEAGIRIVIHENFRFQPWHRKIKEIVDAGILGQIYQATFRLRPGDGQGPNAYLDRQPYFQKMPRFLVHETAIHLIDVFAYLFGNIKGLYADLRKLNPAIAGEDAGLIIMESASGTRCLFDGNRLVDHAAENHRLTMGEMLIEGANAVLRLDGDAGLYLRNKGERQETRIDYAWHNRDFGGDCVYELQAAAVRARVSGTGYENEARAYLENLFVEQAVYLSADTRQFVAIS